MRREWEEDGHVELVHDGGQLYNSLPREEVEPVEHAHGWEHVLWLLRVSDYVEVHEHRLVLWRDGVEVEVRRTSPQEWSLELYARLLREHAEQSEYWARKVSAIARTYGDDPDVLYERLRLWCHARDELLESWVDVVDDVLGRAYCTRSPQGAELVRQAAREILPDYYEVIVEEGDGVWWVRAVSE
ncbi:MAG: hypothetical protein K6T57_15630 [Thermaceae bacterium]|nr:hypothetical protein [Thermaceae bacterium]